MIATMGDAELDEGNIYECLIEAYKHDIRNLWWIVDYNRQSLDATTTDARGKHVMHMETRMSYLGEDCQGVTPADQMAKGMAGAPKP